MRPKQFNFKFVVDTREQRPYKFREDDVRKKLDTGDYSIEGLEDCICVERKEINDFIASVIPGRGWKRFQKELERLQKFELACILLEGTWEDVCEKQYRSELHPHSLQGFIMRILVDYNIPIYFAVDRTYGKIFVEKWLQRAALKFHPALVETI